MRKLRKKFKKPKVSWETNLIKENKKLSEEYGLRRKKEILVTQEVLRGFRRRARLLIAEKDEKKEKILIDKIVKMGLLTAGKGLDDVLTLNVKDVLNRRLQSIVFKKGIATSPLHARQMIVHGHVRVKGRKIKFPSYLVSVDEEGSIEVVGYKPKPKPMAEAPEPSKPAEVGDAKDEESSEDVAPETQGNGEE